MINIFTELDYRDAIRKTIDKMKGKEREEEISFKLLADYLKIGRSFLSKVMNKTSHFDEDQLYLTTDFLSFNRDEENYIKLLHSYQISSLELRRKKIYEEIAAFQKRMLRTENNIEHKKEVSSKQFHYYLNPWKQIVHIALSIPKYQNLDFLSRDLQIPYNFLKIIIEELIQEEYISFTNGRYSNLKPLVHLPENHSFYPQWKSRIRQIGQSKTEFLPKDKSYEFSVIFSGGYELYAEIKQEFINSISNIQKKVKSSESEQLYQINIDFFNWL